MYQVIESHGTNQPRVVMENLFRDTPRANVLVFKLGKVDAANKDDLGFKITGYIIKNHEGKVKETYREGSKGKDGKVQGPIAATQVIEIIKKFFSGNSCQAPNNLAVQDIKNRLKKLIEFAKNNNTRKLTGSNLILSADNMKNKFDMRILNLTHLKDLPNSDPTTKTIDAEYLSGLEKIQE